LLRSRKRQEASNFARPASALAIEEAGRALGAALPTAWQKVLRTCNGGRIDQSPLASDQACLIIPAEKLAHERRTEVDYYREIGAELADSLVLVMQTEIGDSVWLDRRTLKPDGDCRVVLMSHETGEEEREWSKCGRFPGGTVDGRATIAAKPLAPGWRS
jgi:hypothetical protein